MGQSPSSATRHEYHETNSVLGAKMRLSVGIHIGIKVVAESFEGLVDSIESAPSVPKRKLLDSHGC